MSTSDRALLWILKLIREHEKISPKKVTQLNEERDKPFSSRSISYAFKRLRKSGYSEIVPNLMKMSSHYYTLLDHTTSLYEIVEYC